MSRSAVRVRSSALLHWAQKLVIHILMVRKLLTTCGGLFKTGASIAEQLAAKATGLQDFAFGRIPYSSRTTRLRLPAEARRHWPKSGEERDVGVKVAGELRLVGERQWFGGGMLLRIQGSFCCLHGYLVPNMGIRSNAPRNAPRGKARLSWRS